MKTSRLVAPMVALLAAATVTLAQGTATQPDTEKGKSVYAAANPKCSMCHAVEGKGNAKNPLDGVGDKLTADDIKAWIRTPKEMATKVKSEGKPPMMAYSKEKLSDQDLDALVAYLLSLKTKK